MLANPANARLHGAVERLLEAHARERMRVIESPLVLPCGAVLRNRVVKAAMSEQLADARQHPSDELIHLYRRWARSGAAVLITGNVMVERRAISEPGQVAADESSLPMLARWAHAATSGGAQAWMQINHGGRQIPRLLNGRPLAPSSVALRSYLFARPHALEAAQIEALVGAYASTAGLAVRAGFGGVQIHAAHGYLISQFLSPRTNQRNDAWGGDASRRRRFMHEVLAAVRSAIGARAVLALKLNASDFERGGVTEDESLDTVAGLAGSPIDLLEISGGTFESAAMLGVPAARGGREPSTRSAYFIEFARQARMRIDKPLMLTGGFRSLASIESALSSRATDVVGLARPIAIDANLPARLLHGTSPDEPFGQVLHPPVLLRKGLFGGLSEIAWHTVQLWRCAQGQESDTRLSPTGAAFRYLARQASQLRGTSTRFTSKVRPTGAQFRFRIVKIASSR